MRLRCLSVWLTLTSSAFAQYTWDYSKSPVIQDSTRWTQNGGSDVAYPSFGVTFAGSSGGSLIDNIAISGANPNDYEVQSTLAIGSGSGTFIHFLRANSSGVQPGSGSYVSVEITGQSATIKQVTNGSATSLGGASCNPQNGSVLRTIIWGTNLWVFMNNVQVWGGTVTQTTGVPGIGGTNMPAGNGFSAVKLGPHVTTPPNAVSQTNFHWYASQYNPMGISMQFEPPTDPAGVGVWQYQLSGDRGTATSTSPTMLDGNAYMPGQTYNYSLVAVDFHGNPSAAFNFSASQLAGYPNYPKDARRTGVAPTGSYWGAGGEQIDVRSGNMNFALPLLQPQGRTGWSVPLGLSYNSQN